MEIFYLNLPSPFSKSGDPVGNKFEIGLPVFFLFLVIIKKNSECQILYIKSRGILI